MQYVTAWMDGWRRYVQFDGRASRKGYWSFVLGNLIANVVIYVLFTITGAAIFSILLGLWSLITLVPTIAVSVRRLHDHHFSGWWLLIAFTGIGAIGLLVFFAMAGDPGPNRYGAQPGHHASTNDNSGAA